MGRMDALPGSDPTVTGYRASAAVAKVFAELCPPPPDFIVASANGTFVDDAELLTIGKHARTAKVFAVKRVLGESVGASSLWQTISAAQALITQWLPGLPEPKPLKIAVVSACGLNQQVAGLRLR